MSENKENTSGINDPLDIRNTDTGAMKRMPGAPSTAGAGTADTAKKTIKLKPLSQRAVTPPSSAAPAAPGAGNGDFRSTATAPMKPFKKPVTASKPEVAPSADAAKFMSTATGPLHQVKRPVGANAIPATQIGVAPSVTAAKFMSTATGPLHQAQRPVGANAIPATQIGVAPSVTAAKFMSTATGPLHQVQRPVEKAAIPATDIGAAPSANAAKFMSTATGPLHQAQRPAEKPASPVATVTQAIKRPGAAVKLRPGTVAGQAASSASPDPAAQTIKLSPRPASTAAPAAAPVTPSTPDPAAQTIKLSPRPAAPGSTVTLSPSSATTPPQTIELPSVPADQHSVSPEDKTVTLTSPTAVDPSAKTVQLPGVPAGLALKKDQGSSAPSAPAGLSLKKEQTPPPAPEGQEEERSALNVQDPSKNRKGKKIQIDDEAINLAKEKEDDTDFAVPADEAKGNSEPSIFFAITAILALLLAAYVVFALAAQYSNIWDGKNIPVIGFSQQTGK